MKDVAPMMIRSVFLLYLIDFSIVFEEGVQVV